MQMTAGMKHTPNVQKNIYFCWICSTTLNNCIQYRKLTISAHIHGRHTYNTQWYTCTLEYAQEKLAQETGQQNTAALAAALCGAM